MLDRKNLFELAKVVANANPSSQVSYSFGEDKFSYSQLNDTLRNELNELAGNYQLYRENKNLIFSLIEDNSYISVSKIIGDFLDTFNFSLTNVSKFLIYKYDSAFCIK